MEGSFRSADGCGGIGEGGSAALRGGQKTEGRKGGEGSRLLVLCSFSDHDAEVPVPEDFTTARILIGNYDGNDLSRSPGELSVVADRLETGALHLRPYEAIALLA